MLIFLLCFNVIWYRFFENMLIGTYVTNFILSERGTLVVFECMYFSVDLICSNEFGSPLRKLKNGKQFNLMLCLVYFSLNVSIFNWVLSTDHTHFIDDWEHSFDWCWCASLTLPGKHRISTDTVSPHRASDSRYVRMFRWIKCKLISNEISLRSCLAKTQTPAR